MVKWPLTSPSIYILEGIVVNCPIIAQASNNQLTVTRQKNRLKHFSKSELIEHKEDPCISICEDNTGEVGDGRSGGTVDHRVKIDYTKSCCQRGCRFFNLVNLGRGVKSDDFNSSKDDCEASCNEAYVLPQERGSCAAGCTSMAKQRMLDFLSLLSVALYMEEGLEPNMIGMSLDLPESEFITDPGLKKELMPGWWDSNGFKLPQTFVRSVPRDSNMMDYNSPSDYSGDIEQPGTLAGSMWLKRNSHDKGIQVIFVILLILITCYASLYIVLGIRKDRVKSGKIFWSQCDDMSDAKKIVLVYPEELPNDKLTLELNTQFALGEKNFKV